MKIATETTDLELNHGEVTALQELASIVKALQGTIPLSSEGPMSYIDAEVVSSKGFTEDARPEDVEEAVIDLDYSEGFPTVDYKPFWERLDGELIPYYNMFKTYRELPSAEGTRSYTRVAEKYNLQSKFVGTIANLYHWKYRVQAYDRYEERLLEAKRHSALQKMENLHSAAADELYNLVLDKLEDEEVMGMMNPKDILEYLKESVKLKRLSLGVSTDKPAGDPARVNIFQGNVQVNTQVNNQEQDASSMQQVVNILQDIGALEQVAGDNKKDEEVKSQNDSDLIDVEVSNE